MESKIYKYKSFKLKAAQKNLEFRKNNYHFLNSLSKVLDKVKSDDEVGERMIDFLHNEENLKLVFTTFLEPGAIEKIKFDFEDDENYEEVIRLASNVLKDFFLTKRESQKT